MADLQLWWWESVTPSLGDNRKLERPFTLKMKAGVPKTRWMKLLEFLSSKPKFNDPDPWAVEFADLLELGPEPLMVDGKPVLTLREYFEVTLPSPSGPSLVSELIGAFTWHNTIEGMRAHFSERPFGTTAGTPGAAAGPQTAANPPSGEETKH